jgi:hypothetical protein
MPTVCTLEVRLVIPEIQGTLILLVWIAVIMTNNMQRGDIVDSLKKMGMSASLCLNTDKTYFMARLAEILDEDGRPSDKKHPWKTIPQGAAT